MHPKFEFYNGRHLRFFQVASVIAFVAICTASFLFDMREDMQGTRIHGISIENIFFHSRILSNLGYLAGGIAAIWFLYIVSRRLGLIRTAAPCVALTEKGIFVRNQFDVPWHAVVAAREYRHAHIEFDEMWVLIEVDNTSPYIAYKTTSDVAAFYKMLEKSDDKDLASKNFLPINCQKMGIRSDKLLRCIGDYFPK